MAAEHRGLPGPDAAAHDGAHLAVAFFVGVLADSRLLRGLDPGRGSEGRHGGDAAHGIARHDAAGAPREQSGHIRAGLLDAARREGPGCIGSLPVAAGHRLPVPQRDQCERRGDPLVHQLVEELQDLDVPLVGEVAARLLDRHPLEGGDLAVRQEGRAGDGLVRHLRRPEVHDLVATARERIGGDAERDPEGDRQPGLLEDLADRRLRQRLAGVDLALGDGHVAVLRPVDHQHDDLLVHDPPAEGARGVDRRVHRLDPERLLRGRWLICCISRFCRSSSGCPFSSRW